MMYTNKSRGGTNLEIIWLDANDFKTYGGWQTETQFVKEMGQPYLIANHIPGVPVENADTDFSVKTEGYYRIFVRTKNWRLPYAPGQFKVAVDNSELENTCGKMPSPDWYWEIAGDVYLKAGNHKLELCDKTGWLSRCATVIITNDFDYTPSPEINRLLKQRAQAKNIDTKIKDLGNWDFVVVGAGPGGVPAAISAARAGLKTALICARPYVGGNASEEGTIGFDGAGGKNPGNHETGIANEIKRYREHYKTSWQKALEMLIEKEPLLTLYTNSMCTDAVSENNLITSVEITNTLTLEKSVISAPLFADCTGDGWLGYYAGAAYRVGREAKHQYNEEFAPESPDTLTMSGCNTKTHLGFQLLGFYMEEEPQKTEFKAPEWTPSFPEGTETQRYQKKPHSPEWWLENSNDYDDLWNQEYTRDTLAAINVGYFGWLKTTSPQKDEFANYSLKYLCLHNSKRENRRIIGDYVLTMTDIMDGKKFEDVISYHGWGIDVHHPKGIFSGKEGPFHLNTEVPVSPIPYRCLYSKNIGNLFVASRCSSVSHLALGSTRVESTIATMGQAVGTAAAFCKKYNTLPRGIYESHIKELQQQLLKDDQTIFEISNEDTDDKAKNASIYATSEASSKKGFAKNVINGKIRSTADECNSWISESGLPQSITLKFNNVMDISRVQITVETDLTYPLFSCWETPPFYDTANDITIELLKDGKCMEKKEITDNFVRQIRSDFSNMSADEVKVTVNKADSNVAIINEIRIY